MTGQSRFQPPFSTQRSVRRTQVLAQLQQMGVKRVTAIVAPAGYGKTSLASQWYEVLRCDGHRPIWISLDQDQSEQGQFLVTLLEAVNSVLGDQQVGLDVSSMPLASLLAVVSTRLRRFDQRLIVFLDDYHFAQTDATEAVMAKLLADHSLTHLKFVLISRTPPRFPVSALRLSGELKQISMADLGFSDEEAEEFFAGRDGSLTREQIGALNRRTEGWAVALQMVRLLINENAGGETLLASFDGSNADMGNYLSEQVFSNLPVDMQTFLMQTAPLPMVNRDLVVAVFGDGEALDLFNRLNDYALPFAVLGGEAGWRRYHPVFNSFLKDEAARRGVSGKPVLRKAARWFQQQGDFDAAVRHGLMSGDANLAAGIIENAGGWRRVYTTSRGGTNLFKSIMLHAAEIDLPRFPLTTLGLAVVHAKSGQLDAANHYLSIAERALILTPERLASDVRVVRVLLALYFDRWASWADLAALEDDLANVEGMVLVHRALAMNMLSYNFLIRGDFERALHFGQLALRAFRDGGADFGAMHLYTHIGQALYFSGDCPGASEAYDRLIGEAQNSIGKGTDLDAVGQVLRAELQVMRGELDPADDALAWALPHLARHDTWFDLLAAGFTAQQFVLRLRGEVTMAHGMIDRTRPTAKRRGFDRLLRLTDGARIELLLATGDLDQAIRYAESNGFGLQTLTDERLNALSIHLRGTTPGLIWTRIHLAAGRIPEARHVFDSMLAQQPGKPNVPRAIELALLDIRLLIAEDDRDQAARRLADLILNYPLEDYRSILLVEGDALIEQLRELSGSTNFSDVTRNSLFRLLQPRQARPAPALTKETSATVEILTDREMAVMQLLSAGFSNKEIGRKLELSDNTIKFHLRNIFAKLNVATRTAAVTAARRAGLLGS